MAGLTKDGGRVGRYKYYIFISIFQNNLTHKNLNDQVVVILGFLPRLPNNKEKDY